MSSCRQPLLTASSPGDTKPLVSADSYVCGMSSGGSLPEGPWQGGSGSRPSVELQAPSPGGCAGPKRGNPAAPGPAAQQHGGACLFCPLVWFHPGVDHTLGPLCKNLV